MKFEVRMLQAILLTFLLPRPRWWVFVLLVLFQLVVVLILTGVLLMRFVVLMLAANLLKESLLFLIVVLSWQVVGPHRHQHLTPGTMLVMTIPSRWLLVPLLRWGRCIGCAPSAT